jgi:DNA-binding IclR family transcriptional regulator
VTVIRTVFRRAGLEGALTAGFVRDTLHVSEPKAGALLRAFAKAGFLRREKGGRWQLTTTGIRLRGATAARPLLRQTAERLLDELLQRIAALNEDSRYLARVEKAIVFGSY